MRFFVAIVIAVILDAVLGGLWYSPLLFGDVWHQIQGVTAETNQYGEGMVYGLSTLGNVAKVLALGLLIRWTGEHTALGGLKVGAAAWLIIAMILMGSTLFASGSPIVLAINATFHLFAFSLMGIVIGVALKAPDAASELVAKDAPSRA